jgi:hypothetical protein
MICGWASFTPNRVNSVATQQYQDYPDKSPDGIALPVLRRSDGTQFRIEGSNDGNEQ